MLRDGSVLILGGTWLGYTQRPYAGLDLEKDHTKTLGVSKEWARENLKDKDVPAAWHKNANVGHEVDVWLLNQVPREKEFKFNMVVAAVSTRKRIS